MFIPITLGVIGLGALILGRDTRGGAKPDDVDPSGLLLRPPPIPIDPNTVPSQEVASYMDKLRGMWAGGIQTYPEAPYGLRAISDPAVMAVVKKFQVNWLDGAYMAPGAEWPMPYSDRLRTDGTLDRATMSAIDRVPPTPMVQLEV